MYIFYSYQITTTRSLTGTSFVFLLFTKMIKYHHPVSPLSAIIILFSYLYKKQRKTREPFCLSLQTFVFCILFIDRTTHNKRIDNSNFLSWQKQSAHHDVFYSCNDKYHLFFSRNPKQWMVKIVIYFCTTYFVH